MMPNNWIYLWNKLSYTSLNSLLFFSKRHPHSKENLSSELNCSFPEKYFAYRKELKVIAKIKSIIKIFNYPDIDFVVASNNYSYSLYILFILFWSLFWTTLFCTERQKYSSYFYFFIPNIAFIILNEK